MTLLIWILFQYPNHYQIHQYYTKYTKFGCTDTGSFFLSQQYHNKSLLPIILLGAISLQCTHTSIILSTPTQPPCNIIQVFYITPILWIILKTILQTCWFTPFILFHCIGKWGGKCSQPFECLNLDMHWLGTSLHGWWSLWRTSYKT